MKRWVTAALIVLLCVAVFAGLVVLTNVLGG